MAGTAYSQAISASGGTAPTTYAVTSGALPVGLSLSAGGALSGTPTLAGASSFSITATDACRALGIDPGTMNECAMDVASMGDTAAASFIGIAAPRAVVTLTGAAAGCGGCGSTGGGPLVVGLPLVGLAVLGSRRGKFRRAR